MAVPHELAVALAGSAQDAALGEAVYDLSASEFSRFAESCVEHRLLGALADAVMRSDRQLDETHLDAVRIPLVRWQANALRVERMALRTTESLQRAGIPCRVLKGVALAHLIYDRPGSRVFADLDLLVPGDRLDAALGLLEAELGAARLQPDVRPGFTPEFGKDATVLIDDVEVDVHRVFVAGPYGLTIDVDDLFGDIAEVPLGGRLVPVLGPVAMFLHACYNAALGDDPPRLGALRDLMLLAEHDPAAVAASVPIADRWRATAVVRRAAVLAVDTLGLGADHPLAALTGLATRRRDTWYLATYRSQARGYRRQLAALAVIPGVRPRLRYAAALVAPSRSYLASRGWTERTHLRRAVRLLTGRRDG